MHINVHETVFMPAFPIKIIWLTSMALGYLVQSNIK